MQFENFTVCSIEEPPLRQMTVKKVAIPELTSFSIEDKGTPIFDGVTVT